LFSAVWESARNQHRRHQNGSKNDKIDILSNLDTLRYWWPLARSFYIAGPWVW